MTAGSTGSFAPWPFLYPGTYYAKVWNGDDGRYEPYIGGLRTKWNYYSMYYASALCSDDLCTLIGTYQGPYGDWVVGQDYTISGLSEMRTQSQPFLQTTVSDTAKAKVLDKLLGKIKGSDFNLGVNLGQLNQTVDMLAGNLRKLGGAALALRRGDFSSAARALGTRPRPSRLKVEDVGGRWLELQYGWLPLLSDCYAGAKAFEEISNGPRSKIFRSTVSEESNFEASTSPTRFSSLYKGSAKRLVQYEMYEEMSALRQLGLYDPLSIAWELTPWSFVIDWFIPIGNYLSSLNQIPHLKGRWIVTDVASITSQAPACTWLDPGIHWIETYDPVFYKGYFNNIRIVTPPHVVGSSKKMLRAVSENPPPVPFPKFKLNGVNSTKRFLNALALANGRFKVTTMKRPGYYGKD